MNDIKTAVPVSQRRLKLKFPKTYSPYWDRIFRRAVLEGRPDLLRGGRRIEVTVMEWVMRPHHIAAVWEEAVSGNFELWGDLAYLAEYIAHGIDPVIAKTDPNQFARMTRGMAEIKKMGWDKRLKPGPLRARATRARKKRIAAHSHEME